MLRISFHEDVQRVISYTVILLDIVSYYSNRTLTFAQVYFSSSLLSFIIYVYQLALESVQKKAEPVGGVYLYLDATNMAGQQGTQYISGA